jgi:hypothetical protein
MEIKTQDSLSGEVMNKIWSVLKSRVYFSIVCMWTYGKWYPNVDENGVVINPIQYHRELDWPIYLGVAWVPRAGNFCIDIIAFRIFLSIDPFWNRKQDFHASMLEMDKQEWDSMSKQDCWQAGYEVSKHETQVQLQENKS